MKHVFSNDMVAHVWAQQSQDEGRTGNGNFSFRGAALFSYRTMIACFVLGTRKRRACLISSRSFSPTTNGKHLNKARTAAGYAMLPRALCRPLDRSGRALKPKAEAGVTCNHCGHWQEA